MNANFHEKCQTAVQYFNSNNYPAVLDTIIDMILQFSNHNDEDALLLDAIKLAIAAYKKIDPLKAEQILKANENNLFEQYFAVVREYQNHKEETDEKRVQDEIYRFIPLDVSEIRDVSSEESPLEAKQLQIGGYEISIVAAQGPREAMEDTYITEEITLLLPGQVAPQISPVFAIMDGHGGEGCANYVQKNLTQTLKDEMQKVDNLSDKAIYNAFCRTFAKVSDEWKDKQKKHEPDWSGSTVLIALILENKALWVANVGDSRAILGENTRVFQLSDDAKAFKEKYQNDVLSRGGSILLGRVDGNLDMTRSIGDIYHPSIWPHPDIRKFDLTKLKPNTQNLLVLASDGLWNVIGSEQAIQLAQGKSVQEIGEELKTTAYALGSWDNITIIVINLNIPK
ncbi:MAG TPA: PP2C family protein-serine/threonine phosphatase [Waddliaceae bacterium]